MSSRRSRSRSPRRRRSSPDRSRRRSEGDHSHYGREHRRNDRGGRNRIGSSSDLKNQEREEKHRSPRRNKDHNSSAEQDHKKSLTQEPPVEGAQREKNQTSDKEQKSGDPQRRRSGDMVGERDQENHQMKVANEGGRLPKQEESGFRRRSLDLPREKNVLFPSGSNTVNRGRDRFRDKTWREERGRMEGRGRFNRRSEGILGREGDMEEARGGGERRLFEALVDPREVPRSGNYFEHDDRDGPQATQTRAYLDSRRPDRRFRRSPESRWPRGREREPHRWRDSRERLSDDRRERDWRRGAPRDRERRGRDMRSDWNDRLSRRRSGGMTRDRSPVHWKHDLFETLDQSPEPEEQEKEEPAPTKWKSKTMEEGLEDFNIDDLLLMENPIEKMELDV